MIRLALFLFIWAVVPPSQAQQQIIIKFSPAFYASASVRIQLKRDRSMILSFIQTDVYNENQPTSGWGRDRTASGSMKKKVKYFQKSILEQYTISPERFSHLVDAFDNVYVNREVLAKYKDDRLFADGMHSEITVLEGKHAPYSLLYHAPGSEENNLMHQLIKETLNMLQIKSKNPAILTYCKNLHVD